MVTAVLTGSLALALTRDAMRQAFHMDETG
jgi:hypothetical protein